MQETLYHKTSKGELQIWSIETDGDTIITTYGLDGGKMQTATKKAKGKNIGRANETTPEDQAVLEATSMVSKKMDKDYHKTRHEAMKSKVLLPMLAKDWFKHGHKYDKSSFLMAQPKLDGVRCLARYKDGEIELISRGNKKYDIPHIKDALRAMYVSNSFPRDIIFDGELYNHDMSFQEIVGACKKVQKSTQNIEYHIYDVVLENMEFSDRYHTFLHKLQNQRNYKTSVMSVETFYTIPDKLEEMHTRYVSAGYEGLIVRNSKGLYKVGKRSDDLLKYKQFEDSEFKVLDVINGSGKFESQGIFVCEMDDGSGRTFNVTPTGTEDEREEYYLNAGEYINKLITVKYFGRSDDNIPRFPIGKGFRSTGDM